MVGCAERRRVPRNEIAIRVECLDEDTLMVAHDISVGGMMVTTTAPRWPGELVRVRFTLPGKKRAIRATCQVISLEEVPHGVGLRLRFLRLASEARCAVHEYVDLRPVPDPDPGHESVLLQIQNWVDRMVEDCAALRELAVE